MYQAIILGHFSNMVKSVLSCEFFLIVKHVHVSYVFVVAIFFMKNSIGNLPWKFLAVLIF